MNDGLQALLEQNHIFTIGDFRSTATRVQVKTSLIAKGVATRDELVLLQARAELMMLTGIDRNIADKLIAANIDSLALLARAKPDSLITILPNVDKSQFPQW